MSLKVYNRKRNFQETPEPKGSVKKIKSAAPLRFVVQMHDASRLHFDFRLEFDGVFKSWAVPKGPSLNPQDQRLAVFVEDHPLEYGSFEGIIPKGNYGGGTVMVWDQGSYVERGSQSRKDSETAMKKNLEKGHLTFILDGQKLKGEFALIKLKHAENDKSWLLVKKRDDFSTYKRTEIPNNISVKTGRTIEQIAEESEEAGDVWMSKRKKNAAPPARAKTVSVRSVTPSQKKIAPMPRKIRPMIATLSRETPDRNWILEPQLEGLRALAEVEGKKVALYSKAGLSFNSKYGKIVDALKSLNVTALFDGEIVNGDYVIYDLLYWQGRDLREEPLRARREILQTAFRAGKFLKHMGEIKNQTRAVAKNPESIYKNGTTSDWRLIEKPRGKSPAIRDVVDEEPRLTHPDKIFFPEDKITKGDVFAYYEKIAEYILPYLKDRPESMNRHPNGISHPGFYQKDVTGHIPRWLKTERVFSESSNKSIDYLLCQDKRSLLYMANLGCIEINPWFSRVGHFDNPDFLVIDLDPDDNPFNDVIKIAHDVHEILDRVGAKNFCKTSGATGIHIGVPLGAKYDYDTARAFAEDVCKIVAKNNPKLTSVERNPQRRRKQIYLDFMQNRRGQTLAAPFCIRPKPGAPVSMPLEWAELKKGVKPEQFNIHNAPQRIGKFNDPWKKVLGPGVDLAKCSLSLQKNYTKV